jgi:hypothetical protein
VCSIDPGVRTPFTIYTLTHAFEFGTGKKAPTKVQPTTPKPELPPRPVDTRLEYRLPAGRTVPEVRCAFYSTLSINTRAADKAEEKAQRAAAEKQAAAELAAAEQAKYGAPKKKAKATKVKPTAPEQAKPVVTTGSKAAKATTVTSRKHPSPPSQSRRQRFAFHVREAASTNSKRKRKQPGLIERILLHVDHVARILKAAKADLATFEAAVPPRFKQPAAQRSDPLTPDEVLQQKELRKQRITLKRRRKAAHDTFLQLHRRIHDHVLDFQKKLASWLLRTNHVIVIPQFGVRSMTARRGRTLSKATVRLMLALAHGRFLSILRMMKRRFPWCKVIVVDEKYTSKLCGNCVRIHEKLGSNKVFKCPNCEATVRVFLFLVFGFVFA